MFVHKSTSRLRGRTAREFEDRIIDALEKAERTGKLLLLSTDDKGRLFLQLLKLRKRLGFVAGAHRRWPESLEKQKQAVRSRIVIGKEGYFEMFTGRPI
jgi:hypothetical protein